MALDIITTVLVPATASAPASPYDLVDLATVKDELSIATADTNNDSWLSRAISQTSVAVQSYCNRTFQVETVQDLIYPARDAYPYEVPGGVDPLQLSRWPLIGAPPVSLATSADTPSGNVLPFASTSVVAAGQPVSGTNIPPATVVNAVTANSVTLSKPVAGDVPAGALITFGISVTVTDPPGTSVTLGAGTGYQAIPRLGQLVRLNTYTSYPNSWDPVLTMVTYQAGYAAIPVDIVDAVLRLITGRFAGRGRDPMLKSQDQPGLGIQTWWVGTAPGVKGAFTEETVDILDRYRVPVVV